MKAAQKLFPDMRKQRQTNGNVKNVITSGSVHLKN